MFSNVLLEGERVDRVLEGDTVAVYGVIDTVGDMVLSRGTAEGREWKKRIWDIYISWLL